MYTIEHVQGYASADHFTAECARRCDLHYRTLADARRALRASKAKHKQHPTEGINPLGRLDIVRADGRRFRWE